MQNRCAGWTTSEHETELSCYVVVFSGYDAGEDEAETLCTDCLADLKASDMWTERAGMISVYNYDFTKHIESN